MLQLKRRGTNGSRYPPLSLLTEHGFEKHSPRVISRTWGECTYEHWKILLDDVVTTKLLSRRARDFAKRYISRVDAGKDSAHQMWSQAYCDIVRIGGDDYFR